MLSFTTLSQVAANRPAHVCLDDFAQVHIRYMRGTTHYGRLRAMARLQGKVRYKIVKSQFLLPRGPQRCRFRSFLRTYSTNQSLPALPRLLAMYALALSCILFAACHALAEPIPGKHDL
jgi:hypothetical protein